VGGGGLLGEGGGGEEGEDAEGDEPTNVERHAGFLATRILDEGRAERL
jgi:hypothetical protein